MITPINDTYFESLRHTYKSKSIPRIQEALIPLVDFLISSDFLKGKLRFHPLGFMYCKLHEFQNTEVFRMHIWNSVSKVQKPIMNIHNHYYDVNSFIYKGKVSNDLYEINKEHALTHTVYSGSYQNESTRVLTKTDDSRALIHLEKQIITQGELYYIKKNEIHSGDNVDNEVTITFVYSENPGNPTPLVFGPLNGEKSYTYNSNLVDEKTIDEIKIQITSN
jgi:hypothetical protein